MGSRGASDDEPEPEMVFDWEKGHGSVRRMLIAALVAASILGGLLAYVEVREPALANSAKGEIDLTMVNLEDEEHRWLAEMIDRETLFHRRWDVSDPSVLASVTADALSVKSPRTFEATLLEIESPPQDVSLSNLPGMEAAALPLPDSVDTAVFASPPVNWWVEVSIVDGLMGKKGLEAFSFPWPEADPDRELSEGEIWTVLVGVDWQGQVVLSEPTIESQNARTPVILAKYRSVKFPALSKKGPLRWWKLEALIVNHPYSE